MKCSHISVSGHAVRRMFQRGIKRLEVTEIIASYPDDQPHPGFPLLGFAGMTPVHVVVAQNQKDHNCVVVTAYIPDAALWAGDFRKRRE